MTSTDNGSPDFSDVHTGFAVVLVRADETVKDPNGEYIPKVPTICVDRDHSATRAVFADLESAIAQAREYRELFPDAEYQVWSFNHIS